MEQREPSRESNGRAQHAERLCAIASEVAREMRSGKSAPVPARLASRLDRDLGLDSLGRAELLARTERAFGVGLPRDAIAADTLEALLSLVLEAGPQTADDLEPLPPPDAIEGEPRNAATLKDAHSWHAEAHPDRVHVQLYREGRTASPLTYRSVADGAYAVAAGLAERGVARQEPVALMLPTGSDYLHAFLGILLAGGVPAPIYPPARPSQLEEHLRRHGRILTNAGATLMITVPEARRVAKLLRAEAPDLRAIVTVAELSGNPQRARLPAVGAEDLALLQYTSGSTGDPKGVMLTHAQLLANIRAMGERLDASSMDVFASWLPLYHDMGLIGAWLGSLYYGVELVLMSPLDFLSQPLRWLRAIHRHRATISGGPNFGYELCLRALEPSDLEGLDLSHWRVAFNGAEPVSVATLERFAREMAAAGFRREALMPVYGLAEVGVGLTLPEPGHGPRDDRIEQDTFAREGIARPAGDKGRENTLSLPSCGPPLKGFEVRVVDASGYECPERHEGDLEFRGPSATRGYYRNTDATRALYHGDWLRTGDRGYMADGEVYVSGRVKDVIVRGGRNVYPYELEDAVGAIPGIRKGCVAAFGTPDPGSGIERLIVVAETREQDAAARRRLREAIIEATVDVVNVPADDVRLAPPHAVLKTSSGKIRRSAVRDLYLTGRLGEGRSAVWWQVVRLAVATARARSRHRLRFVIRHLYAAYAWSIFGVTGFLLWCGTTVVRSMRGRWRLARALVRGAARCVGIRIDSTGLENLPSGSPCVVVSNHASYVDALVLTAVIPRRLRYLAKRELAARRPVRVLLQRLGVVFVERLDPAEATRDSERVVELARAGESLVSFPEGTFGRGEGVGEFHLGAFVAAAVAGLPVVPVALRGTRSILRGTEWFPRPGRVRVTVGKPLAPSGSGLDAAISLRDAARAFIVVHCGEPDLVGARKSAAG